MFQPLGLQIDFLKGITNKECCLKPKGCVVFWHPQYHPLYISYIDIIYYIDV